MASPFSGDSLNVLIMAHMMQIIQFDFRESTMINYDQFTLWLFNIPIESIEKGASVVVLPVENGDSPSLC